MIPRFPFRVPRSAFASCRPWFLVAWLALTFAFAESVTVQEVPTPVTVALSDEAMGTTFSVEVHGHDRARLESVARAALAEAARVDRLLSNYQPDSEWSAMNRSASRGPFAVSAELFDLLAACLAYSRDTEGAFDVSVGPLMKVWGFFKGEGTMPTTDAVTSALAGTGAEHVRLDPRRVTVEFLRPDVELDPGGIGKGYAIDRMAAILLNRGVTSAFVSAGGSSIYGLGAPPDSPDGWPVIIRHPRSSSGVAAKLLLKDSSLSTSGSYEKFFRAGGRDVLPHHGPAHRLPSEWHVVSVGRRTPDGRQRGVDEGVLHQRPGVGGDVVAPRARASSDATIVSQSRAGDRVSPADGAGLVDASELSADLAAGKIARLVARGRIAVVRVDIHVRIAGFDCRDELRERPACELTDETGTIDRASRDDLISRSTAA